MFSRSLPRVLCPALRATSHVHPPHFHAKPPIPTLLRCQWPPPNRRASTYTAAKKLWLENPLSVTLASILILFGASCLLYSPYIYHYYVAQSSYPEPVALKLRRAIYYSTIDIQPRNAVKYYKQALLAAQECGMDAFSDEVLGIKIKLSALMQNIGDVQKAIEVLEVIWRDCGEWVGDKERGGKEGREKDRGRVLRWMVKISVRIGELYADERVGDQEAAEERLVWAVTTVLKERERRGREGLEEGNEEWLSEEEVGGALESLGNHYEAKNQHFLAAPLFLQAVAMIPHTDCHAITLMNNLSISLALQNPPPTGGIPSPSSTVQIDSARTWAQKALDLDKVLKKAPTRTEECDTACAVTQINLGEFAEMEGSVATARRLYAEGADFSRKIGFQEGVVRAREAIQRLDKRKA